MTKFWVGGGLTSDWSSTGPSNWSDSSGGPNGAALPGPADDVIFDANSVGPSTISIPFHIKSLNCAAYGGLLTLNAVVLYVEDGSVTFSVGMLLDAQDFSNVVFLSPNLVNLATAGHMLYRVTMGGVGTLKLLDDLVCHHLSLTKGTLDANGHNPTMGVLESAGSQARTLKMGSGVWTVLGGVVNFSKTGLTIVPSTSTLKFVGLDAGATITAGLAGFVFNKLEVQASGFTQFPLRITGANTFTEILVQG